MKFENRQVHSDGKQISDYLRAGTWEKNLAVQRGEETLVSDGKV